MSTLEVLDHGEPVAISFDDLVAYHGRSSIAGLAHGFKALKRTLPLLAGGSPPERYGIWVDSAFAGDGARDAVEMVTRAVTGDRYRPAPELAPADAPRALHGRFFFRFLYEEFIVDVKLRPEVADDEFVDTVCRGTIRPPGQRPSRASSRTWPTGSWACPRRRSPTRRYGRPARGASRTVPRARTGAWGAQHLGGPRMAQRDCRARRDARSDVAGSAKADIWAQWVLGARAGGDRDARARLLRLLGRVRDRVLDRCELADDATVVDVGAGDGLLGFGALQRMRRGRVIFADVSAELLADCQETARRAGAVQRCEFVSARAEDLEPLDDRAADAVLLRAVLMYVADKQRAFAEFFRVLRPGGRLWLYEPVNRVAAELNAGTLFGYEPGDCEDLAGRIAEVYRQAQSFDSPMMDFDEVDLFRAAERAGFEPVEVELHVEGRRESLFGPMAWGDWLQIAPNPLAPSFGDAIRRALDAGGQQRLEQWLRPLIETGRPARVRRAGAYLWPDKPASA